ncbi:AfsR/SARP family transcriptional regulator [Amycolatopsis cynarae]|uniref:AfsR/SARP family transcriptional regulator n=1 Tax=Amycolatopsis cynarae TaxID=2995223 RepID=A0ABY7ASN5_9PSEU|nr:AfsR/SARP family transcriptional regulator [Amycolatopsis sp. HUAS 11-8]WAL62959.1 AfsR/SARP family transcriptional regulator [Amycolatopsis sp. HUAS 11-8]
MTDPVDFRVLGPLDVRVGGRPVAVKAHRERATLAALLFHPNEIVSTGRLAAAVWDDDLPANPANQIAICVLALRRRLRAAGAPREFIITRSPGYLIRLEPGQLDTLRVESHLARVRDAEARGEREEALAQLRSALRCWRGPVLPGLGGRSLAPEIVRWEERRVELLEQCVQRDLDLGRHRAVIGELTAMVADRGMRERPREQLMIALYRSGRRTQALSVYQVTRKLFLTELGIEPSARLCRLRDAIRDGTLGMAPGLADAP